MTPADAEAAVERIQATIAADAPAGFLDLVLGNPPVGDALVAFKDEVLAALSEETQGEKIRQRLAPKKTDVVASLPHGAPCVSVERLLARAVEAAVQAVR